ncbi:DUF402 domain-containing protein [Pseudarthrobacter sp. J1738]|uniref:DUF402 domain-containing protein n=1 Tax=unclassified Pseudarthrobacter TaxID=2647000 RepID=UPI003D272E0B
MSFSEFGTDSEGPQVGDLVVVRHRKYNGGAHWLYASEALGQDHHGVWLARPAGTLLSRPGVGLYSRSPVLLLIPRLTANSGAEYMVEFFDHQHPGDFRVYADIVSHSKWTPMRPAGWEISAIDMDLDVVRSTTRGDYIDDEDEFLEHQEIFGYPQELIAATRNAADQLFEHLEQSTGPFDGSAAAWFEKLYALFDAEPVAESVAGKRAEL